MEVRSRSLLRSVVTSDKVGAAWAYQGLSPEAGGNGAGGLSYEHETAAGSEAIAAAGRPANALPPAGGNGAGPAAPMVKSAEESIGRNDPCWCGSGKKFKRCHGA